MSSQTKNSKHAKYSTGNPISRFLVQNFFTSISELYSRISIKSVLDVGCGEGLILDMLSRISPMEKCCAMDKNQEEVNDAKTRLPFCDVKIGDIYSLDYSDSSFDLIICNEVLEHLDSPEQALIELERVCGQYAILSVPREPLWRTMNIVRLKYLKDFGNPPEHLNHWSKRGFINLISPYFDIVDIKSPVPWNIVLCRKKTNLSKNTFRR